MVAALVLSPFHFMGWMAKAPVPLKVLPPLLVMTLIDSPVPIGVDASTPPVFTCVSWIMSDPVRSR